LAVAGFAEADLEISTEENQLLIRGRQAEEEGEREFLHRGIAARQFQRSFVLAEGMRVTGAELCNGLLSVELDRPQPERLVRKINISVKD
jgi:HSP20 family molecular chaperone IbpA